MTQQQKTTEFDCKQSNSVSASLKRMVVLKGLQNTGRDRYDGVGTTRNRSGQCSADRIRKIDLEPLLCRIELDLDPLLCRIELALEPLICRIELALEPLLCRIELALEPLLCRIELALEPLLCRIELALESHLCRLELSLEPLICRIELALESLLCRIELDGSDDRSARFAGCLLRSWMWAYTGVNAPDQLQLGPALTSVTGSWRENKLQQVITEINICVESIPDNALQKCLHAGLKLCRIANIDENCESHCHSRRLANVTHASSDPRWRMLRT